LAGFYSKVEYKLGGHNVGLPEAQVMQGTVKTQGNCQIVRRHTQL